MIRINSQVPDMELSAFHEGEIRKVRLSDYRGRWLIMMFYPADFTFVCPTELEEAADAHDEIKKLGAEVVSVSTDTAYAHKAWHEASPSVKKIRYPMLADAGGRLSRELGTYSEEDCMSVRATFIVDPDGIVKAYEMHSNDIGRSIREIIRKLQAAKFVKEHKGLVCPASWVPGKKTLTTATSTVGKL